MKLYLAVKFNKNLPDDETLPSAGGFEVETKDGKSYEFDFFHSDVWVDNDDENTVFYCLKDEDTDTFPEIEEMRHHLADITKIKQCYIDTECYDDDTDIRPVKLLGFCLETTVDSQTKIPQSTDYLMIENISPERFENCIVQYEATDLLLDTFSY